MIKKYIRLGLKISAAVFLVNMLFLPAKGYAAEPVKSSDPSCEKFLQLFNIGDSGANPAANLPQICTAQGFILRIINILNLVAGSVAVIFIIIGGFRYLTSAGNEEQSEQGKKTLITSVIGLAVVILAATIVRIVATTLGSGGGGGGTETEIEVPEEERDADKDKDQYTEEQIIQAAKKIRYYTVVVDDSGEYLVRILGAQEDINIVCANDSDKEFVLSVDDEPVETISADSRQFSERLTGSKGGIWVDLCNVPIFKAQ